MRALWPKRRNLYHRGDVSAGERERVQAHGQERVSALLSTNRKTSMADSGCAQGDNSRFTKDRLSPAQRSPIPGILPALITSLSKKIYGTKIVQKERTSSNVAGPRRAWVEWAPTAGRCLLGEKVRLGRKREKSCAADHFEPNCTSEQSLDLVHAEF